MNNVRQFPNSGAIKDEAAAWVVRMHGYTYKADGGIPDNERQAFEAWIAQSQFHRDTFLKMLSGWDAMSMLEELADILPLSEVQNRAPTPPSPAKRLLSSLGNLGRHKWAPVYGTSVVASLLCLLWVGFLFAPEQSEYETRVGEQASFVLSDGSTIRLNTDTKLRVDFSGERRVVTLERGEANFEVFKDREHPFVVYAGDGMVWAVGTAFNVSYRDSQVNVIVSEGTVKVFSGVTLRNEEPLLIIDDSNNSLLTAGGDISQSAPSEYFREVVLDAGEGAQYSQRRVSKEPLQEKELLKTLAWQQGVLVFQGETLEQALSEISRYTDRQLVIIDPSISNTSVGGRFKVDNIDELVHSLALGLNIKTEQGDGNSILFSAR